MAARGARIGAALAAAIVLALLPWSLDRLPPRDAVRLTRAHFSATVDDPAARAVTLPHRWALDCPDCPTVWYRFDLTLPAAPRETQALYFPSVADNLAVYLNGRLLGQGGRFDDPVVRFDERPFLAVAAVNLFRPGSNIVYVLAKADPARRGVMHAPYFGAEDALQATFNVRSLLRIAVPQILAAAIAMLGVVMLALWANRRREASYGWLAAACLAWAALAFAELAVVPPLSARAWDVLLAVVWSVAAAATWGFALALIGGDRGARWVVLLPAVALVLALLPAPAAELARVPAAIAFLVLGALFTWVGARSSGAELWPLALGPVLLALAANDLAGASLDPLLPYAVPVVLGAGGWTQLGRFVASLNAAELLNVDLEALVREKTVALEAQHERTRRLERANVLAAERERLMRDMHDGIGGHLVSTLALIESGRAAAADLAGAVRAALDDMRLVIDSLDPVEDDLNAVLAMLRDRLAPRLTAAGITFHDGIEALPPVAGLTPARVLDLLRLLQEAVTNAVKHGGARAITLAAHRRDDSIDIELADDGRGFDPGTVAAGRGLKNMQRRAAQAGARLTIESAPGNGTRVRLHLPLHAVAG
jgi:signal transduction histidine kinase